MQAKITHMPPLRGFLESDDGIITRVIEKNDRLIRFEASFKAEPRILECFRGMAEHFIFSERSRIARIGVMITAERLTPDAIEKDRIHAVLTAVSVINGFPSMAQLNGFFVEGFPVGRLVFCDPDMLLSSDEVLAAIHASSLKLPAQTTISSSGDIVIAPHRIVCEFKEPLNHDVIQRILMHKDGREVLNRYQIQRPVSALIIPPGDGIVTTCSMYLNEHYVVLQSGSELGRQFPATVLDPIKTRGIRIYLEIANETDHPIVNPLVSAKIYRAKPAGSANGRSKPAAKSNGYSYETLRKFENRLKACASGKCRYVEKPAAVIPAEGDLDKAAILCSGPDLPCTLSTAACASARRDFSSHSPCPQIFATSRIREHLGSGEFSLVLAYFPGLIEHRDIVNLAHDGNLRSIYFFEPSVEHGPFLSEKDHHRLQEYDAFGVDVYWVCGLNGLIMKHTMRDGMGYFVAPERLKDFHKSMIFAFYGSNRELSDKGKERMGRLFDELVRFWGPNIGIITGGGSGVMGHANSMAQARGILSGANFLDITDQQLTTDVDFCQVFQSTCRHSRQKWFEVASFPIFNIGGIGSLEEIGITLCNMKLSILEPVPVILFDTEGDGDFWEPVTNQIRRMVEQNRTPAWILDRIIVTNRPETVIKEYRKQLELF